MANGGGVVYNETDISRLYAARISTRKAVEGAVLRMYTVLESQRLAFVNRTPNHPLAGTGEAAAVAVATAASVPHQRDQARSGVEEAFACSEHQSRIIGLWLPNQLA